MIFASLPSPQYFANGQSSRERGQFLKPSTICSAAKIFVQGKLKTNKDLSGAVSELFGHRTIELP